MLTPVVIRRLTVARYLFHLALDNGRAASDVTAHASIQILQDAIEMFLIAVGEQLNLALPTQTAFAQYLDKIGQNIGHDIPYRKKLIEINRVRVASKHDGILPDKREMSGYLQNAQQFFEEATNLIFKVDFWSISLIDLLDEEEEKAFLTEAENQFRAGEYLDCLVSCRRAFFVRFEESYNIKRFEKDDPNDVFSLLSGDAPRYARTPEFIEKNVESPFDYIVRDHTKIDAQISKEGLDHTTFWNIWRLTPEVYRFTKESDWLTKVDPGKVDHKDLKDTASYVLDATISIMLQLALNRRQWRSLKDPTVTLTVRSGKVPVYKKADKASAVLKEFEAEEGTHVIGQFMTPGLRDTDEYWCVGVYNQSKKLFAFGYIAAIDVVSTSRGE